MLHEKAQSLGDTLQTTPTIRNTIFVFSTTSAFPGLDVVTHVHVLSSVQTLSRCIFVHPFENKKVHNTDAWRKNEDASKAKLCTRLSTKGLDKREAKFASTKWGKLLSDVGDAAEVFC